MFNIPITRGLEIPSNLSPICKDCLLENSVPLAFEIIFDGLVNKASSQTKVLRICSIQIGNSLIGSLAEKVRFECLEEFIKTSYVLSIDITVLKVIALQFYGLIRKNRNQKNHEEFCQHHPHNYRFGVYVFGIR
jgi:hypothetical protein